MLEAMTLTESWSNNNYFTADLQLCRVGLNVQWANPELFDENFIFHLGGRHFLMSLCTIWFTVPQINAKAAWVSSREISERRTCPTPQTGTVGYKGYRNLKL